MTRRRLVEISLAALLAAVAGLQFQRVFGFGPVLMPALGSAILAAATVVATGWRRNRPIAIDLAASLAAFYLFTAVAVLPSPSPSALADGIVNGWAKILSSTLPVPPQPTLLVPVAATAWFASWFGTELVRRSSSAVLPVLPSLLVFVTATFLGVGGAGNPAVSGLVFAIVALAVIGVRSRQDASSNQAISTRAGASVAFAAVLGTAALAVMAILPLLAALADDPADPRENRELQQEDLTTVSPLATLTARQRSTPVFEAFSATFSEDGNDAAVEAPRMRLTALDRYDGTQWSPSGGYVLAGGNLPVDENASGGATALRQDVTVADLGFVWLPAADRPVDLVAEDVRVDPGTGVLMRPGTEGGYTYKVTSEILADIAARAETAAAATSPEYSAFTQVPAGLPEIISKIAADQTEEVTNPYLKMLSLEKYLRQDAFTYTLEAPTGHSYGRLEDFLVRDHRGSDEQFASMFAVMARSLGYPSRVVIGYLPREGTLGSWTATSADLHAWPEVAFAGVGWVPFAPSKQEGVAAESETLEEKFDANADRQSQAEAGQLATTTVPQDAVADVDSDTGSGVVTTVVLSVFSILAVTGVLLAVLVFRRRRIRASRRDKGDARHRVIGAWHEVLDLVDTSCANGRDTTTMTASEVAGLADRAIGSDAAGQVRPLGRLADVALYDPEATDRAAPAEAWRHVAAFERSLLESSRPTMRWRLMLLPRRTRRDPLPQAEAAK